MDLYNNGSIIISISFLIIVISLISKIRSFLKNRNEIIVRARKKINYKFWGTIIHICIGIMIIMIFYDDDISKATQLLFVLVGVIQIFLGINYLFEFIDGYGIFKSYIIINGISYDWDRIALFESSYVYREALLEDKKFLKIDFTLKDSKKKKKSLFKEQPLTIVIDIKYEQMIYKYLDEVIIKE